MKPKYFIGPMSKNVVDAIIEFCNETNNIIGLIPSRRQVEYNGGYVNSWTTEQFAEYVKSKTDKVILKRDHSGPGQGYTMDDGYESLKYDCKYLDLIHIDPWKKCSSLKEGIETTINMINYCYNLNPNIQYEVGTEEAIWRFNIDDLETLVSRLKYRLLPEVYNQIKYLVIQSGTSLKGNTQTGHYDKDRLIEMVELGKRYDLITKEHNGDYIPVSVIKEKFALGLDSINIAPEFGLIETQTYIDNEIDIDKFWKICYDSKRWEKWVDSNFDPFTQKEELIKICGHYVLSTPEFLDIKPNTDDKIKSNIKNKLNELYA
jgi:fructose/tagatose bisphosphate aldolase